MMKRIALGLLGFALFLATWQALLLFGIASDRVMAFPSTLIHYLAGAPPLGDFGRAMLASGVQFGEGFGVAALFGIVLGLVFGWYRSVGALLEPLFAAVNAVPLIAVIPLLIVLLGLGAATELTIVGLFAFFPVYFGVSSAAAGIDPALVRMCRAFGGREWDVISSIVLPATVPAIISGLRLGIGRALTGLVVVELFMGRGGLGSVILDAVNQGMPNLALLAVVVLGCANLLASGLLRLVQSRVEIWRPGQAAR
jgi:ABC-type nitrate/sulfonate/bicarbonate transport system permease component